jgi:purine-binding chemotaxis protein CheW
MNKFDDNLEDWRRREMKETKIDDQGVAESNAGHEKKFDECQLVGFRVGAQEFGVDIRQVREIIRGVALAKLPDSPDFIEGVVNLRGSVTPVVDLRKKFSLEERTHENEMRIIVTELKSGPVGFMVDNVTEVRTVKAEAIESVPATAIKGNSHYVKGIAKLESGLLIMLDFEEVLSSDEAEALSLSKTAVAVSTGNTSR